MRKHLSLRLTELEYQSIQNAAQNEGRSASNYIRNLLFSKKGK
jgi:predicted DNA-binding protein